MFLKSLLTFSLVLLFSASSFSASHSKANYILIEKSKRKLSVLNGSHVLKTYKVSLGGSPVGDKVQQGDNKTPEGIYKIELKNSHSNYYKAFRISYPDKKDIEEAAAKGVKPGGDIMIHGLPNGLGWVKKWQGLYDWTRGCIALSNEEIDEIWDMVDVGTTVEIKP
ncbi:L,D-transpeptidase family protein [bacterium]|nr:L,D-transpeptidase family protein [bacterium]